MEENNSLTKIIGVIICLVIGGLFIYHCNYPKKQPKAKSDYELKEIQDSINSKRAIDNLNYVYGEITMIDSVINWHLHHETFSIEVDKFLNHKIYFEDLNIDDIYKKDSTQYIIRGNNQYGYFALKATREKVKEILDANEKNLPIKYLFQLTSFKKIDLTLSYATEKSYEEEEEQSYVVENTNASDDFILNGDLIQIYVVR